MARALGYQKPDQAVRTNVSDEDSTLMGVSDSNNHTQQMKLLMSLDFTIWFLRVGYRLQKDLDTG